MAARLKDCGFKVIANPFGILYNPISIAECIARCRQQPMALADEDLVYYGGIWHSWHHHSKFSNPDRKLLEASIADSYHEAHQVLEENPIIIVTLGTAYLYEHNGHVVANCHKVPANQFIRRLASVDEVSNALDNALHGLDTIVTISPIRHWADTPHGNQLSKSTLMLATQEMGETVHYFPAYEIMMDELRDYRFYEADMLHPSPVAIEIIWQRFAMTFFDKETLSLAEKYQQLHRMEAHRPQFPESEAHRQHLAKIELLRQELRK